MNEYWVVSNDGRYAYSLYTSLVEAKKALMENGLRATHHIMTVKVPATPDSGSSGKAKNLNGVKTMTSDELQSTLSHFTGSDEFYRHFLNRRFLYTQGVEAMAASAKAYWLIDELALRYRGALARQPFLLVRFTSKNQTGRIVWEDGNGNKVGRGMNIQYTDFPEGEWQFYIAHSGEGLATLMLPSEY